MVTTSKSMHREVQIKHDLMTRKEKTNSIYIFFYHSHVQVFGCHQDLEH